MFSYERWSQASPWMAELSGHAVNESLETGGQIEPRNRHDRHDRTLRPAAESIPLHWRPAAGFGAAGMSPLLTEHCHPQIPDLSCERVEHAS
jgi:hypothetical protein